MGGKRSVASELMRIEIQKKGKLPASDRYKRILKKRLQESKQKAMFDRGGRKMSKRAEQALKEIAAKKAAKEAKALRRMVIVQPQNYHNGSINRKGQIYDVAGNMVAQVNIKNGKIATMTGWGLGKYKPKSAMTKMVITDAIDKFSPYYINLRKMQAMQNGWNPATGGMGMTPDVINVHGPAASSAPVAEASMFAGYGEASLGPRQNIVATSWGARSDNVWGTFTDNVWGKSTDNVWGTNTGDVWGGIGGNPFGQGSIKIWGTGNGINYLRKAGRFMAALFGLKMKTYSRQAFRDNSVKLRAHRSSRGSTPTPRGPVSTRR